MSDKTPVDELEGRQLDAAVAEEVMGEPAYAVEVSEQGSTYAKWKPTWSGDVSEDDTVQVACPAYSTEIDAAWEVVEHADVEVRLSRYNADEVFCDWGRPFLKHSVTARGSSAPEAICRAALKAVRAD